VGLRIRLAAYRDDTRRNQSGGRNAVGAQFVGIRGKTDVKHGEGLTVYGAPLSEARDYAAFRGSRGGNGRETRETQ